VAPSWLHRRADRLIALCIFLATTAVTCVASHTQGVHRDEAVYMEAGERYISWAERGLRGRLEAPLSARTIATAWDFNSEHPPLMKWLFGLSWRLFARVDQRQLEKHPAGLRPSGGLGLTDEVTAFRLPTMAMFGLLAAMVYLAFLAAFGRRRPQPPPEPDGWPPPVDDSPTLPARAGALAAALLTVCQPRAFFHAETAAFDLPAATMWFICAYAYWRALDARKPWRAALLVGVLFGLFLATKLQSFFLPFALSAHAFWLWARSRFRTFPNIRPLVAMAVVGPLVCWGSWPYLWHDTWAHLRKYLAFHASHVNYNFEYLGHNYNNPPFPITEPLGMLLTTAPVVLLALAAAGIATLARSPRRRDARATRAWLLLVGLVPILPFMSGHTPIFGATKHWLATMPCLAICAGVAVQAIVAALPAELGRASSRLVQGAVMAGVLALAVVPAAVETARSHPYGLSHYNALVGGAPGGADLGMNRQFWGYSPQGLFAWMNANLPQGARVYPHDLSHYAFLMDQRAGRLRPDLVDAGMEQPAIDRSQAALLIHELHFVKYDTMIWNAYGKVQPTKVLAYDGVPLVSLYTRP
jgi:4-amino-4-deoxy-L-arabinose transferase-like glycosyltransferase